MPEMDEQRVREIAAQIIERRAHQYDFGGVGDQMADILDRDDFTDAEWDVAYNAVHDAIGEATVTASWGEMPHEPDMAARADAIAEVTAKLASLGLYPSVDDLGYREVGVQRGKPGCWGTPGWWRMPVLRVLDVDGQDVGVLRDEPANEYQDWPSRDEWEIVAVESTEVTTTRWAVVR